MTAPALPDTARAAEDPRPKLYLCRQPTFDIRRIWWHSHHWN